MIVCLYLDKVMKQNYESVGRYSKKIMKIHPKGTMLTLDETKKRYETLITKNKFIPRVELLRLSIEDEVLKVLVLLQVMVLLNQLYVK